MFYYKYSNHTLVSRTKLIPCEFEEISDLAASHEDGIVYLLTSINLENSRSTFCISHPSLAFLENEGLELLKLDPSSPNGLPPWLVAKIEAGEVSSINTRYPNWQQIIGRRIRKKWKINIAGLGDVGGTLVTGLRLMGGQYVSEIGLYDRDDKKINRWVFEAGQIYASFTDHNFPDVYKVPYENVFDCDMFVFTVSSGVPPVGSEISDVRMAQFNGNSNIIKIYARMARECGFKGIFAVVSDPVDLLCKAALMESNMNENGEQDFKGLRPEQIRGYGLGVMNARAAYYARQGCDTVHYLSEGRAFGPHGEGLVIADSIINYNDELSIYLTEKAKSANMEVRASGFKPYIAPALSSGALPIISTISGTWHYSATYMGGVFMGAKNRLTDAGVEIEANIIPAPLWNRLCKTYERLGQLL